MSTRVARRSGYGPAPARYSQPTSMLRARQLVHPSAQLRAGWPADRRVGAVLGVEHLEDVLGLEDRLGAVGRQPGRQGPPAGGGDRIDRPRPPTVGRPARPRPVPGRPASWAPRTACCGPAARTGSASGPSAWPARTWSTAGSRAGRASRTRLASARCRSHRSPPVGNPLGTIAASQPSRSVPGRGVRSVSMTSDYTEPGVSLAAGRMPLLGFGTWQISDAEAPTRSPRARGRLPPYRHRDRLPQRGAASAGPGRRGLARGTRSSSPRSCRPTTPGGNGRRSRRA